MDAKEYSFRAKQLRKERKFREAQELLEKGLKEYPRDIFIISNLISVYGKHQFNKAKDLFDMAVKLNIATEFTYCSMLNIYVQKREIHSAKLLFDNMEKKGLLDDVSYSTILNLYVQNKDISSAKQLFDKMEKIGLLNEVSYSTMLNLYVQNKDIYSAKLLFDKMEKLRLLNEVSYGTMLQLYYVTEKYVEGLDFLSKFPTKYKNDLILNIYEIEFNRKLKNYDLCLELISNVSKNFNLKDNGKVGLQTIRAYCFKEMGRTNDAVSLLRNLLKTTKEDCPSYIRIVCGLVFCDNVKPHEVQQFTNVLMKAKMSETGNDVDVEKALKIISRLGNEDKIKCMANNISSKDQHRKVKVTKI